MRVLLRVGLIAGLVAAAASSAAQPPPPGLDRITPAGLEIVKVDPSPVAANETFSLVVRLTNRVDRPLDVVLSPHTDFVGSPKTVALQPRETRVIELPARFALAGLHDAAVQGSWRTDKTILVLVGPSRVERRSQYADLGSTSATVNVLAAPPVRPQWFDLGPEMPPDSKGGASPGGVIGLLEGSRNALFAVSKAAGVWRSVNQGPWQQLSGSPPRAFSLAIDPSNGNHLFVGERDDDVGDIRLGRSRLWESVDFGATWLPVYDPLGDTGSQAIPSLAMSRTTSTLFLATRRGVGRLERRTGAATPEVTFAARDPSDAQCGGTGGLGTVTAVTASARRIWARSTSELFFSDDDGRTFRCRRLPANAVIPGIATTQTSYGYASTGGADSLSLAAFDDRAYVVFKATVPPSDPRALADVRCDPSSKAFEPARVACNLPVSPLLTFAINQGPAGTATESWIFQNTRDNDGTGLNGRRLVRTLDVPPSACPLPGGVGVGWGGPRQLIYMAGQSIQQAVAEGPDGRIVFDAPVYASAGGPPPPGRYAPMHSDVWDVLLPTDYCPISRPDVFAATDGGVYRGSSSQGGPASALDWTSHNAGLRTHTVQSMIVTESKSVPPPVAGVPVLPLLQLAYATMDNDGWSLAGGAWRHTTNLGDANYAAGDVGGSSILLWRQLGAGAAALAKADGAIEPLTLNYSQPFDGPTPIQAIQSLATEDRTGQGMDLVMLVQLPIVDKDTKPIAGPLGAGPTRIALIRTTDFDSNPDPQASGFAGWSVVADNLPQGAARVWISGGHQSPTYFLFTTSSNTACPNGLSQLRTSSSVAGRPGWACLTTNLAAPDANNSQTGYFGPAFVNPFDPSVILVARAATGTKSAGVEVSTDGGANFCILPSLTNLVSGSGMFAYTGTFHPGATYNSLGSRYHGVGYGVPAQVAFNRNAPQQVLVASPYTGLFFSRTMVRGAPCNAGSWPEPEWLTLTPHLPNPYSYIGDVSLIGGGAVVGTRGRGAFSLANLRSAQPASYVVGERAGPVSDAFAHIRRGDGAPLSWARAHVTVLRANDRARVLQTDDRADESGDLRLVSPLGPGDYVMTVSFPGDGEQAPSSTSFLHTVP